MQKGHFSVNISY